LKYKQIDFTSLLQSVTKPSRYINNELNSSYNEPTEEKVNFCFAFPDVYEVGFSHLGVKILYSIINNQPDATADRVYAPWDDFGSLLKENNIPLFSYENRVKLLDYDVIGFTLQTELTYTNILYILDLAQITIRAEERGEDEPLVIAGGPCAAYPEGLALFFDLFFIGEAEEGIVELKELIKIGKQKGLKREELLHSLKDIPGVYIPSLLVTDEERNSSKSSQTFVSRKYLNFGDNVTYQNQLISWQQATHDRYISEIMRGCSRGCRFCFAGYFYRPVRERSVESIVENLIKEVKENGWEETALLSLSSSDYSCIKPLLIEIVSQLKDFQTDLSLPSLRADSVDETILKLMRAFRQNGITIAPEAGSQRLRDIINKDITEQHIFDLLKLAVENNWRVVKLYFIIGLPFETIEDVEEIVELVKKIAQFENNRLQINITLSPFIPKPHTPFQWIEMLPKEELLKRIHIVKNGLHKYKRIKVKYHDVDNSMLECVLNRGGREVGELIELAYEKGAMFDGWDEFFDFGIWKEAAQQLSIDLDNYRQQIPFTAKLPWDHIDIGIERDFLIKEVETAEKEMITPDCRTDICSTCGACYDGVQPSYVTYDKLPDLKIPERQPMNVKTYPYRVTYSKVGLLRFVSHLDSLRMIHRLLRASRLPIAYTQGFNRHPKIKYGPPLAVGVEGENEYLDFYLEFPMKEEEIMSALQHKKLKNWEWKTVQSVEMEKLPPLSKYNIETLLLEVPESDLSEIKKGLNCYKTQPHWFYSKKRKGAVREIDLMTVIKNIELNGNLLTIRKKLTGASVYDILDGLFLIEREETGAYSIKRTSMSIDKEEID